MSTEDIVVEADLDEPPAKVWRALTEPALLDAWLLDGEDGIACEVIDTDPERSVRYAWRDGGGVPSEVSFEIAPAPGGGTRLRVAHSLVAEPVVLTFPRRVTPVATAMKLAA